MGTLRVLCKGFGKCSGRSGSRSERDLFGRLNPIFRYDSESSSRNGSRSLSVNRVCGSNSIRNSSNSSGRKDYLEHSISGSKSMF